MSLLHTKQAETEIPLSPEEKYEASKLIGRSLFSAMQLARLQEEKRNQQLMEEMPSTEDDKVLNIPIPSSLMPVQKVASSKEQSVSFLEHPDGRIEQKYNPGAPARYSKPAPSSPAYEGLEYDQTIAHIDGTREHFFKPKEGKGAAGHIKRNIGKYMGTGAGALLAASMKGKARFLAPLAGLSLGKGMDDLTRETSLSNAYRNPDDIEDSLAELAIRQRMMDKKAEEDQLGLLATALSKAKDNPVRMILGGQTGFRDAKKEYYFQQKAQMQKELMEAQKEYIDTLNRIKTGEHKGLDTPCVDAFCNGIAHYAMFGKKAEDVDIADDSLKRMLGEVAKKISSPLRPAAETVGSGLLNTAAGTAYLTYLMRKKMREEPEKYMEQHLPTRVELQPY